MRQQSRQAGVQGLEERIMGENKRRNDICTQLVRLAERLDADNAKLRQVTELAVQARSFMLLVPLG